MSTALEAVNAHYAAIIAKDLEAICAKYVTAPDTYVFVEGPRYSTLGHEAIRRGWTDFCASAIALTQITWTEGPYVLETQQLAAVSGIIELQVDVGGRPLKQIFRASFVLQPGETGWQIRQEHVSIPHPDPYGIGDWLKPASPDA